MIEQITGTVQAIAPQKLVITVAGGIGLGVSVPSEQLATIGQVISLYAYMHWNAENGPSLYGFMTETDRQVFLAIINCPGIGPKIGLGILQAMPAGTFIGAIACDDTKALCAVPGIGARKAEGIIVALKGRLDAIAGATLAEQAPASAAHANLLEVTRALSSLGYERMEITRALATLKKVENLEQQTVAMLLKKALAALARGA
jgi:Holliday junction DNA helicase RuvA